MIPQITFSQNTLIEKVLLDYKIDTGIRLHVGLNRKITEGGIIKDIVQWVFDNFDTAGVTSSISNGSRTATGDYLQQWNGYNLAFNGVKDVIFTGTTGNYTYFLASGQRELINNHSSGAIMDVKDGGTSGSDTVAIKGWPKLPAAVPNEFLTIDAAGDWCHSAISVPVSVNKSVLLSQTGAITASSYNSTTNALYEVKGFVNVLNIATDVLNVQVVFTDENGNVQSKTLQVLNSTATANVTMTTADHYSFCTQVYGKSGTTIRVKIGLIASGGSDTYDIYVNTVIQ